MHTTAIDHAIGMTGTPATNPPVPSSTDPAAKRVVIPSELSVQTRQKLKMDVVDMIAAGHARIVLDAAQCGYVDTSGLGVLVSLNKKCREAGGWLLIEGLNEEMRFFIAHVNLDSVLTIEPPITAADRAHR